MYRKEEARELRMEFWKGFKRYCVRKKANTRWVLTGVKIKSTQLKFFADHQKALVMFQIDHKNALRRYEVYEAFYVYKNLFSEVAGDVLKWEVDYEGIEEHQVSAVYFLLEDVSLYNKDDWEKIYRFFIDKMPLLEQLYFEYRDMINARLKDS